MAHIIFLLGSTALRLSSVLGKPYWRGEVYERESGERQVESGRGYNPDGEVVPDPQAACQPCSLTVASPSWGK